MALNSRLVSTHQVSEWRGSYSRRTRFSGIYIFLLMALLETVGAAGLYELRILWCGVGHMVTP